MGLANVVMATFSFLLFFFFFFFFFFFTKQSSRKVQDCLTKLAFFFFFFFFFFFSLCPAKTFSLSDKCPVNLSKENNILTTNMPSVLQILICPAKDYSPSDSSPASVEKISWRLRLRLHIRPSRYFIIQERFNKLIYGINTMWQPVKFQLGFCSWNEMIFFYRISELMLPTLIRDTIKKKIILFLIQFKNERLTEILQTVRCHIYQFIKPFLDIFFIFFLGIWSL